MKNCPPYSHEALSIKKGTYQHYKGNKYEVLDIARLEATLEEVVVYRSYKDNDIWIRPVVSFLETVILPEGQEVPRFRFLG